VAKKLYIVLSMIAALFAVGVAQAGSPAEVEGCTTVDAATAEDLFHRRVPFVDVRSVHEYDTGHIPGAVHLSSTFGESELAQIAIRNQEIVIYCDGPTCSRSSKACKMAGSSGYKNVYYFRDGYPGWKAAGYPSE
jgi:rhodanese-related sulfurtransferase